MEASEKVTGSFSDNGLRWKVGDGKSIQIYKDNWFQRSWNFKILSTLMLDSNALVNDLFLPSGGWNIQKLKANFRCCDVDEILKTLIDMMNTKDTVIWQFEGKGAYSIKSGYWLGRNLDDRAGHSNTSVGNGNFFDLIIDFANQTKKEEDLKLFCIICWRLWCIRNDFVHNDGNHAYSDVLYWSTNYVKAYETPKMGSILMGDTDKRNDTHWKAPSTGYYKVKAIPKAANCVTENLARIGMDCVEDNFWMESFSDSVRNVLAIDLLI
ncbi:hypothetical protein LWI28_005649 [Acer negundo]|uniref:Uncharacterized protein n=1 Tax=Acer negundo TaxID=4023 RepID=A0AAD5JTL2_ACENE|nr:hypothetical protein LWI28_005649 [Acer negundo]